MSKRKVWTKKGVPGLYACKQRRGYVVLKRADKKQKRAYQYESHQAAKGAGWRAA